MENQWIIGVASVYNQSYYFNPIYKKIPQDIQKEIKEICIFYAEKLHCIFKMKFDEEGSVSFETVAEEIDYNYDEIGSKLDIDKLIHDRREFIKSLSLWYKFFMTEEGRVALAKAVKENKS